MTETTLATVEVETGPMPRLAVIWLHGLGADGHDFEPIVPQLGGAGAVRYVFPHAPHRSVTVNGGYVMRAWYDILGFEATAQEDAAGIRASAAAVTKLVDREIGRGVPAERIVLAGFSQGGAIALHTALRDPRTLGGVLALSTYLPLAATLASERSAANAGVPIFMAHGSADAVLPLTLAERSRRTLEGLGYTVDWQVYPMPHAVCQAEIEAIDRWLARIGANSPS
ncbi:MAG TPA: dienelactone hydrolase family protein [Gammaproteobacteria bacterium]|nr:dienelactone hydrolase family protein [Gammaproteobacteria bacterium]